MENRKKKSASRWTRRLMILTAIILFAGLFIQITMLARVSGQNKRAAQAEAEIERLSSEAENLELVINEYHNLDDISIKAQRLGMSKPDASQIRVVSVALVEENPSIQTAERIGREGTVN